MKISTKEVRNITGELDQIIEQYKKDNPEQGRDWRTYEQRVALRVRHAIARFEPLIGKAIAALNISDANNAGNKHALTLKQRTVLLLTKHLFGKSNREMSAMLALFSMLSGIDGVDASGDGTGYTLTIKKHYATEAQKFKDKAKDSDKIAKASKQEKGRLLFIYSFALMDFTTRLYIAFGTSFKSEQDAYNKAMQMAAALEIDLKSIRLDRYYSCQQYARELGKLYPNVTLYLIPKKNATVKGPWNWKRTLERFAHNVVAYLKEY